MGLRDAEFRLLLLERVDEVTRIDEPSSSIALFPPGLTIASPSQRAFVNAMRKKISPCPLENFVNHEVQSVSCYKRESFVG